MRSGRVDQPPSAGSGRLSASSVAVTLRPSGNAVPASAELAEAPQIMRAAGLRPGARKPLAAERLRADHRADLVAVDVDVAGMDAVDDLLDARLDAGVQAEGQAVALAVDVGQ